MDKKILKERLDEVKNQLRTNAKDVHFFDKLIDEALSLNGQLSVEPIALDCGKETDEWKGDTFRITLTDKGVLYHEYGGYSVFTTPNNTALYEVLCDLVKNKEEYEKREEESIIAMIQIITYNLSMPRLAFLDFDFAQNNAIRTIQFIKETYDKMINTPLQKETPEQDEEFKNLSITLDKLARE